MWLFSKKLKQMTETYFYSDSELFLYLKTSRRCD